VKNLAKVISIKVPEDVSEDDIVRWVAEGLARKMAKKLILKSLEKGLSVDLDEAIRKFEETRDEAWKEVEKEYKRKGLL